MVEFKLNSLKTYNPVTMKKILYLSLFLSAVLFFTGCKKEEPATIPVLATSPLINITATSATGGGIIISDGGAEITAKGICWGITANPVTSGTKTEDGDGKGQFVSNITGIDAASLYHVRAYATNSIGTAYGADLSFSSSGQIPSANTLAATDITATCSTLNGTVNAYNSSTTVTFEYGLTTEYGSITQAAPSSVTGKASTSVNAYISDLTPYTTYHFRVKAVNSTGTEYGADMSYTTLLADIEGNVYNTVTIGTQVWMKENLKTTKYNDGTAIPNITDNTVWSALTTGAYSDCNNIPANANIYGRQYNWYVIDNNAATKVTSNGGKNVCPTGWHVPSDTEWKTLTDYLTNNGFGYGGSGSDIAKSMATTSGWPADGTPGNIGNDQTSNNQSGFSALAGGYRAISGVFLYIGTVGAWWSSDMPNTGYGSILHISYNSSFVASGVICNAQFGVTVRCLHD
jgi:uncharacterized protein (TIGR02145 family)